MNEDDNLLEFSHRIVEVGSSEWQREVMDAINELIDRFSSLESYLDLRWNRQNRTHECETSD